MPLIKDAEVANLSATLPEVIFAAKAPSTNSKYRSGWRKWVEWCEGKQEISFRPAEPFFVALYLNYVFRQKRKVGSITAAFYGIRWGHHIVGLESPTENPFVKLAFEGTKRLCNHKSKKKEPLEISHLKEILDEFYSLESYDLRKVRTTVVSLLGFTGFLRIDELITIQLKAP